MSVPRSLGPCLQPPCGTPGWKPSFCRPGGGGGPGQGVAGLVGGGGGLSGMVQLWGARERGTVPCPGLLQSRVPVLSASPVPEPSVRSSPWRFPPCGTTPTRPPAGMGVQAGCRLRRHMGFSLLPWFLREGVGKPQSPSGLGAVSRQLLHHPLFLAKFNQISPSLWSRSAKVTAKSRRSRRWSGDVSQRAGATGLCPAEGGSDGSHVAPQLFPGDAGLRRGSELVPRDHRHPRGWEQESAGSRQGPGSAGSSGPSRVGFQKTSQREERKRRCRPSATGRAVRMSPGVGRGCGRA